MEKYGLNQVIVEIPRPMDIDSLSPSDITDEKNINLILQRPSFETYCIPQVVSRQSKIIHAKNLLKSIAPNSKTRGNLPYEKSDYTPLEIQLTLWDMERIINPLNPLLWQITLTDLLASILYFQTTPLLAPEYGCFRNEFSCDHLGIWHGFGLYGYFTSDKFLIQCKAGTFKDNKSQREVLWQVNFKRSLCIHNM